ncbi:MAG: Fe-S cluster assembly ATPase SufC [Longimicrobiales bacterium]|nr:Fe-S cluster assembly ATPase SufC [Longimicrobiales bacterium]
MSDAPILSVEGLEAQVAEGELGILKGVNLKIGKGEIHAIMGPNGSGKSTLAKVIAGHPSYEVTSGKVTFRGEDLLELEVDERSQAGVFLAFQYPLEIPGVSIANFLRTAVQAHLPEGEELDIFDYADMLTERMEMLEMDLSFAERHVNDGFSGGEKKRNEILQMAMLKPKLAVMDETDSGLDIDALKIVANGVNKLVEEDPEMSVLLITHYQRLLDYIKPDYVHVMVDGRIVQSGGPEVALELEADGYKEYEDAEAAANAAGS